jgi:hypothetical protein
MQVRICDKCKMQYGTFPEQAVRFPIVKVNVTRNYAACVHDNEFAEQWSAYLEGLDDETKP